MNIDVDHVGAFRNGNVVFIDERIDSAIWLRDMEDDFGICPFPKYTEADEYQCSVDAGDSLYLVPVTIADAERTSMIIEGMASESYKNVTPQYYDIILKTKHVRDPESSDVIDILRKSRVFDFGYYSMTIGLDSVAVNLHQTYGNADNLVSFYESKAGTAENALKELMQKYDDIAESQAQGY